VPLQYFNVVPEQQPMSVTEPQPVVEVMHCP
jgi:hypothetical protein